MCAYAIPSRLTRKTFTVSLVVLLFLCNLVSADLIDATCRVMAGRAGTARSVGTGIVYRHGRGYVWIATNAHVVGQAREVECVFYHRGHEARPIAGQVSHRSNHVDVAIITIPAVSFGRLLPPYVPLAPAGTVLPAGTPVLSIGSAGGTWPTLFRGHVRNYSGTELYFTPPPANGRSGSGLVTEDGQQLVGLVFARGQGYGLAVSVNAMYQAFGTAEQRAAVAQVQYRESSPVPMPEVARDDVQACPPGGQLFPRLRPQPQQPPQQPSPSPWSTLPPDSQQPVPPQSQPQLPPIDLGPIKESLDGIGSKLDSIVEMQEAWREAQRQKDIKEALPVKPLVDAGVAAITGDVTEAGRVLSGPAIAGWAAGGLGAILVGWLGLKGLWAVLFKLAVAAAIRFGFSFIHQRFRSPERNETNEVLEDVAEVVAARNNRQGNTT